MIGDYEKELMNGQKGGRIRICLCQHSSQSPTHFRCSQNHNRME